MTALEILIGLPADSAIDSTSTELPTWPNRPRSVEKRSILTALVVMYNGHYILQTLHGSWFTIPTLHSLSFKRRPCRSRIQEASMSRITPSRRLRDMPSGCVPGRRERAQRRDTGPRGRAPIAGVHNRYVVARDRSGTGIRGLPEAAQTLPVSFYR